MPIAIAHLDRALRDPAREQVEGQPPELGHGPRRRTKPVDVDLRRMGRQDDEEGDEPADREEHAPHARRDVGVGSDAGD